jgi:transcriptional regulator with XRE-family HTH domain
MNGQNQLANKLKTLRLSRNLSATLLAEAVGVTHAAISTYESGKRTPSEKVLENIAKVLNGDLEELKKLREIEKSNSSQIKNNEEEPDEKSRPLINEDVDDDYLNSFIEHLRNMDKDEQLSFIKESEEKLYASALNKLKPFTLKGLQQEVMQIKAEWYSLPQEPEIIPQLREFYGGIVLEEDKPYFHFSYKKIGAEVSLLFNEKQHLQFFTDWFGAEPTATWTVTEKVQHLPKPVKLEKHLWIHPKVSPSKLMKIHSKYNLQLNSLKFNPYFEWQISNLMRYQSFSVQHNIS